MTVASFIGTIALLCFAGLLLVAALAVLGWGGAWVWGLVTGLHGAPSQDAPDYVPHRPQVPPVLRRAVLERDGYRCVVCGSTEDLELDHEIARSRGGATSYDNLRVLCHACNQQKGAR